MTSANVELVRSICAAWERGDFSSAEWAHPEVEFVMLDGPDEGRWTGLGAMAKTMRDRLSVWEDYRVEPEEYRELDNERVLVLYQRTGRGKTSGLEVGEMGSKGAALFHLRDGKVIRLVLYATHDRAIADLGLDPEAGSPTP